MTQRVEGRVTQSMYEIVHPDGSVVGQYPLSTARTDRKLAATIKRNGWPAIPEN